MRRNASYRGATQRHRILHSVLIAAAFVGTAISFAAVARPIPEPFEQPEQPQSPLSLVQYYMFVASMDTFQKARNDQVRADVLDWSSDGCSNPVEVIGKDHPFNVGDFLPSCQRHDFGHRNYSKLGLLDETNRKRIDDNFKKDLYNYCGHFAGWAAWRGVACRRMADVYYFAVRECGGEHSKCEKFQKSPEPAPSASSTPTQPVPSIGKLFTHANVFGFDCTGTVLDTPKHDIVLTAKHCTAGIGKWALAYFAPGYDGSAKNSEPYGKWKVKGAYDGPGDLEVLVMDRQNGKNIQDVVGGQSYRINVPIGGHVSIIGYPSDGHDRPYYCGADATVHVWKGHPNEWQTNCGKNFNTGVSGSPYMIDYDTRTHRGTVVAALGGDNEGGIGPGEELSLGDPLTSNFDAFLQDVLRRHA